jgi:class 3 adenylate cyclase
MAMPDEAHIELKQTLAALRRELEARTAECTRHWPGSARRARSFAQSRTLRPTSGRCSKPSSRAADLCDCRVQRGVAARREAPASYWPCTSLRPRWIGLPSMHTGLRLLRFQEARALLEQRGGCLMDVETWLRDLGLEQYEAAFRASEIDWAVLPELTPEDLKDIGVAAVGHRRKLLAAIAALRGDSGSRPPAAEKMVPAAERRQITVMFSDVAGSTALSTRLDPEDLRELLGAYQNCVAETIGRYDGFVARYMGDGVLAYFGYPYAHEDDAERAVRAGLAQIEAVRHLQIRERLQIRVGIGTGLVVVGSLGIGEIQEWDITGETPNLAARLQAAAEPNTVVIDPRTRRLVGNLFEYRDLGAACLKGFAEPVRSYEVLRPSVMESRFEALRPARLTPLVGREEEIALIRARWAQAKAGSGRVVLISAEPGIGKSRLAEAFQNTIEGEQYRRLRFFSSPHHQDSAMSPFIGHLERAAGFAHDDAVEARLDKLEALLAPNASAERDVPLLAELLSLPFDHRYTALNLTALRKKQETFAALLRYLASLTLVNRS